MADNNDAFDDVDFGSILDNKYVKKYWHYGVLFAIFLLALWIRFMPGKSGLFTGIDPYYLSRMTQTLIENGLTLPHNDPLRYAPTGIDPHNEFTGIFYIPAIIYLILNSIFTIDFHTFAIYFPAVMGALFVIPLYLIGKELHSKTTGLFAAFFYSVSSSVLFRSSAGFFEKESIAGFFMLVGLYYFIMAIKDDSLAKGLIGGLSLSIMATVWGGVQQILLGIVGYIFLVILFNKQTWGHLKAHAPVVFLSLNYYGTASSIAMMHYAALILLVVRLSVEKYGLVKKESLSYFGPVIFGVSGIIVYIGALFSTHLAGLVNSTQKFLFYSKEVIESTVAENADASWTDFVGQFGVDYAKSFVPSMSSVVPLGALWLLAFASVFVVLYRTHKEKDIYFFSGLILAFISFVSYNLFMKAVGDVAVRANMQAVFVFSFVGVLLIVARKDHVMSLILLMMYSSMLGTASKLRIGFILGPYMAIMGAYFMSNLVSYVSNMNVMKNAKELSGKINIYSILVSLFVVLVVASNTANGYVIAKSMEVNGPSFTSGWQDAMDFLKTNTTEDSVILSWWDFGYWFQTMGERPTNLDGGNNIAGRNRPTAQFFTGMMNETQQKFYLDRFGTDYILVDYSMIGKYAAMSKIANYGEAVESYMEMGYTKYVPQGNSTVLIYSAGSYNLWVPVSSDGRLDGNIVLSSAYGQEAYVRSVCSLNGEMDLNPPSDKPIIDACVFILQDRVFFASDSIANSVFTKLYLMDGNGLDYVEKVFDNGLVKIFKLNTQKADHSELVEWWKTHSEFDLMVKK